MDQEFRCIFANSGQEALEILEKQVVHVIISDMKMPVMDGLKLLKIVREKYPEIVRIVLSGYTQLPQVLATVNQADIFKFITKPWQLEEELIPVIHQAIEYYNAMREREDLRKSLENRNQLYQNVLKATQEKLSLDRKNYEDVKKTCGYVLDEISAKASKIMNTDEEDVGIINNAISHNRRLLLGYLDIAMSNYCQFTLKRIVSDFEGVFSETIPDFKIKTDNKTDLTYYGNYSLFQHIVASTVKQLAICFENPNVVLSILSNVEEDAIMLYCIVEVSGKDGESPDKREAMDFNVFFSFFSEMCRYLSGQFGILENNNILTGKISVQFKKN